MDSIFHFSPYIMRLTDESKAFYFGVYSVVRQIPYGYVTNYGM
ncbi:MAG: MGMT family protein [Asgard group archaeon]|nr:MGMT family protein [Asgard group archaeon]